MITTGIIRQINLSSSTYKANKYLVELNIFQIPGDENKKHYTYEANCCLPGGMYQSYNVGDIVYVGFINEDKSLPVILGKIYKGLDGNYRTYARLDSLDVQNTINLSLDVTIGELTYEDLRSTVYLTKSQVTLLDEIRQAIDFGGGINSYESKEFTEEDVAIINQLLTDAQSHSPIIVDNVRYTYLKLQENTYVYQTIDYDVLTDAVGVKFVTIPLDILTGKPTAIIVREGTVGMVLPQSQNFTSNILSE